MMRTIETTGVVNADHTITVTLPDDVPAGPQRFRLTLIDAPQSGAPPLIMIDVGPWPEGFTASREQIYGDDGR